MRRKKAVALMLCLAALGAAVVLLVCRGRVSGDKLFDYIAAEGIVHITVQKTIENSAAVEDLGSFALTPSERERFYALLSETRLKDLGARPFAIHTEVRYYVSLCNSEGYAEGTMKFYGNDTMLFDYASGGRPAVHKRYAVESSSLQEFFDSVCQRP